MERDLKIKFWLSWTKNLIKLNPIRTSFLLLGFLFTSLIPIPDNAIHFHEIRSAFVDGKKHYYLMRGDYSYTEFNSPQKVFQEGNDYYLKEEDPGVLAIIFIVASSTFFIFFIFGSFMEEWELKKTLKKTIKQNHKIIEIRDGMSGDLHQCLISYNKILIKSWFNKEYDVMWSASGIETIEEFFNCEDYFTQAELRDRKLDKLGIK